MNSTYPNNFEKEICIVDISYLTKELSRIHDFKYEYAGKLIDRFIFHEKENRDDDIFAQPLLKISRTQVILSQALISSLNLDRFIERQFIRYEINMSEIGHVFEKEFIDTLRKGYLENVFDTEFKRIPNFKVNTNEIKFIAFDDKDIEFDVVAVLGDYIILTELKAVMTSYDLSDLEKRKQSVKKAIEQLQRRKESIKHDWDKIKKLSSIVLPNQPFDEEHIICIACTDSYDYTPSKNENIFITDDSTFLKYFTCPYVYIIEKQFGITRAKKIKNIWKNGYPDAKEFMEYLMNPVTVEDFFETMEKRLIPIPIMDKNDLAIFKEDYILKENPFNEERLNDKK